MSGPQTEGFFFALLLILVVCIGGVLFNMITRQPMPHFVSTEDCVVEDPTPLQTCFHGDTQLAMSYGFLRSELDIARFKLQRCQSESP